MSKANSCYGLGQSQIFTLPLPKAFATAPTSGDTNYEIGQIGYVPGPPANAFYIYAGGGSWVEFATSSGDILNIIGNAPVAVSIANGVATISMTGPANVTSLTQNGILIGNGTSPITASTPLTTGQTLVGVTGSAPVAQTISNASVTNVGKFTEVPSMSALTGGVAAVTINTTNVWAVPQWSAAFEQYNTTVSSAIAPTMSAIAGNGMNIDTITGAASKSIEITEGNSVNAKNAFVIGTSAAFYVKAAFNIATLADVTDLYVGFRKVQAYQATIPAGYTDYATIGVHGTAGLIELQTQVGSGGNTVTSTTQSAVAATIFTVEVLVSATGVVTYLLNGAPPTAVAAYTFTSALTVIPYIIYTTPAGGHAEVDLVSYTCGLQ